MGFSIRHTPLSSLHPHLPDSAPSRSTALNRAVTQLRSRFTSSKPQSQIVVPRPLAMTDPCALPPSVQHGCDLLLADTAYRFQGSVLNSVA